jgi:ligand-binding sensor domain-containing protein/signal transduction histidine kinase
LNRTIKKYRGLINFYICIKAYLLKSINIKSQIKGWFFCVIILSNTSGVVSAQAIDPTNLLFRYLTLEDGLPNNKVNAVAMDKHGFIWFGTNDGVCRYDGLKMKYYVQDHLIGNQARTSQVSVIKKDTAGNLFIGSYSLFRYNYLKDRIEQCDTSKGTDVTGRVFAIEEGTDGTIWIGSENGLFSYNNDADDLTSHPANREKEFTINALLYDDNKIWVSTRNDGLYIYYIDSGTYSIVKKFRLSKETKNLINCFFKDDENRIWAGTQDNGIFKFNTKDSSLIHIYPDVTNDLSYRIRKIIRDKYGNIWVGCRLGLFFQKAGTDSLELINQVDQLPSSSRSNSIYDIFIDSHEVMWTGTFSFGVGYTDFKRKPFHLYNLSDEETMFFAKMINCFTDCDSENIWIGTEEGGLFCFNRYTRKFKQYKPDPGNKNSVAGLNVKTLARETDGNLWIGYYNSGLDYLTVKTGQIKHFANDKSSSQTISSNLLRSLILDNEENLWIGTDKGVDFLKKGTSVFLHYNLNIEVLTLYKDNHNNIWAGTSGNGIYRFNRDSLQFESIYPQYFSTTIKALHLDSNDNLWVGTNKGLYFVDSKTDSLVYAGMDQGLPSNAILSILEDNGANLWVSTGAGLIKCKQAVRFPRYFRILRFGSQDGLQGEHFREFASYKNKSGEFYFGGVQGFNIFSPDSVKTNPYFPEIAFTQLKVLNKDVLIGDKILEKIVLQKAINETDLLMISYKHSPLNIEFAALHYSNPKNNQYRYKLMPLEKEWNYSAGIMNFASYSNLRGGDYEFIVEAANCDGLWNPESRILKIDVIPPFWETWWFLSLIIFILSASAIGYYYYRISLLKRYNAELEKKVDDRTHKLKESLDQVIEKQTYIEEQSKILNQQKDQLQQLNSTKDKFFSIIAHDLRSPFQTLLSFSDLLLDEIKGSNNNEEKFYARTIQNSSNQLYTLVENLLTWSRTQRDKVTFEPAEINLSSIIDSCINLLVPNLNQKKISFNKQFQTEKNGFADKNMIEMVIRNLFTNAIKFTPEGGKISISLSEKDNELLTVIKDNGIGISPEDQLKLFRIDTNFSSKGTLGEKGTGLGLIICKEFIEKNNGKIWIESKTGEGSSFFFTIPVIKNPGILDADPLTIQDH